MGKRKMFEIEKALKKRWLKICIAILLVFATLWYIVTASGTGIGGQSFTSIGIQCLFKSVYSQDFFLKPAEKFKTIRDIFANAGSGYYSRVFPTDKNDLHNYTDYYDIVLQPYLDKDIKLLEIGVKKGGSMKMWRTLLSQESRVYGMDIDPGVPTFVHDTNIKVLVVDSHDESGLIQQVLSTTKFDVIIDDGNHSPAAQRRTAQNLLPFLQPTGLYIIEDVQRTAPHYYTEFSLPWTRHADRSFHEHLVFLYPPQSIAPRTDLGLLSSG
eukprot:TRINITY_DN11386_c0_g1_i2.p1 TRINITY_DN11386_c0_g1~~TRINITY_DN11386_c0_g1_i2.p1  ORF type:complete len:269 (+),score=50.70 TRINITY_DN11386_c0_g1_i2:119-925(+)